MINIGLDEMLDAAQASYRRKTVRINEVECLIEDRGKYWLIAPRGTEGSKLLSGNGWRDILRDIRAFPWHDKRVGWSHSGFLKGAQGLVDDCLKTLISPEKPLVLVGHSMGGAIALNAGAMLAAEGYEVALIVTFGSPRTFLKNTAKKFCDSMIPCVQYSNDGDPVTNVPWRWWHYRHAKEVLTGRSGYGLKHHSLMAYRETLLG